MDAIKTLHEVIQAHTGREKITRVDVTFSVDGFVYDVVCFDVISRRECDTKSIERSVKFRVYADELAKKKKVTIDVTALGSLRNIGGGIYDVVEKARISDV